MGIKNVLIVDDEKEIVEIMAEVFTIAGYIVSTAHDGVEALKHLFPTNTNQKSLIDLVVTDLEMPKMNGINLIKTIRGFDTMIPILVITGFGSETTIKELKSLGVIDCIHKPISAEALIEHVNNLSIELQRIKRELDREKDVIEEHISQYQSRLLTAQQFDILGRLASGVMHDIANLTFGLSGYIEMVLNDIDIKNNLTFCKLSTCKNITQEITNLISQFQAFSRNENIKMSFTKVSELIKNSLEISKTFMTKANLEFAITYNNCDPIVYVNSSMLQVALLNLYLNAKDAMCKGGIIEINIGIEDKPLEEVKNSQWCTIAVKDNGTGIPDEVKNRIFEPFFTTKGADGNGLGLANVLSTVIRHQGNINVESTLGQGSTFTIHLPMFS